MERKLSKGTEPVLRGPEEIRVILSRILAQHHVKERLNEDSIYSLWKEVVGQEIAAQTRVVKRSGGVLTVEVASAPLLQELSTYYRAELLESLRARPECRGIQEIRFRAASMPIG